MLLLFGMAASVTIPLGALPDTWANYRKLINEDENTFQCFDHSKIIKLSQINDGVVDCLDGSDESGTGAYPIGYFYCKNDGSIPKTIPKAMVGNGICDCCDGSDEFYNTSSNCSNICKSVEKKRMELISNISTVYSQGIEFHKKLIEKGENLISQGAVKQKQLIDEMNELLTERDQIQPVSPGGEELAISLFKRFFIWLWKFTFHVPIVIDEEFSQKKYRYPLFNEDSLKKIDEINEKIVDLDKKLQKLKELDQIKDKVKPEFLKLYRKTYQNSEFEMMFMVELMYNWVTIGVFKEFKNNSMIYDNGYLCNKTHLTSAVLNLRCWNETKLLEVRQKTECEFYGTFVSPAACDNESVKSLKNLSLEELEDLVPPPEFSVNDYYD